MCEFVSMWKAKEKTHQNQDKDANLNDVGV